MVRDFVGQFVFRGTIDMRDLLTAAETRGVPLLSGVDIYDVTTFNRKQSVRLADELGVIAQRSDDLEDAIASLRDALRLMGEAPHRYLVFNGD